jgi:hypothetical protein
VCKQILHHHNFRSIVYPHNKTVQIAPDIENQHASHLVRIPEIQPNVAQIHPYRLARNREPGSKLSLGVGVPFSELSYSTFTKDRQNFMFAYCVLK